jgi:hypothetical protein
MCGRDAAERIVGWDYGDGPPIQDQLNEFRLLVASREGEYSPVIAPCGFDLARTRTELPPLLDAPGFRGLRAVRDSRVFLADGFLHFNRPGPRIAESLEIYAEILHPGRFEFGHRGLGWEPLDG